MTYFESLIVMDEKEFLVINKPAGLQTEKDRLNHPSVEGYFSEYIHNSYVPGHKAYIVHRLDRPVSGLLVLAKTKFALTHFQRQIDDNKFRKTYIACCEGIPENKNATLRNFLVKNPKLFKSEVYDEPIDQAKESILNYELIHSIDSQAYLSVELKTGRYHQIRAQLSYLGHPLWNDVTYGAQKMLDESIIGLHAYALQFIHPSTKKQISIAKNPQDFPWNDLISHL